MIQIKDGTAVEQDPAQQMADAILDRPALLFAGQGSQVKGMGKDIAEADKDAMNLWREAEKISGLSLREIYWDGEEKDMSDTRALQPALTVANINLWQMLSQKHDVRGAACAGHSLGEFAALVAAGALSPRSAIEITALRGRLMAEADPSGKGGMAAIVKLDKPQVDEIVRDCASETGDIIVAANYNMPLQTVVSGAKNAVALACEKAKARKGRGIELKVSGAFHSPMMDEANRELKSILEKAEWRDPSVPVYCNATARPAATAGEIKKNIIMQMISPVYWVDIIRNLYLAGIRWWMEISPRAVLGKMVGPSMAGLASQCDDLRIDLINSLSSMANLVM